MKEGEEIVRRLRNCWKVKKMKEGYEKSKEADKIDALTQMFMESEQARANERAAEANARAREEMSKQLDPLANLAYLNAAAQAQRDKFRPGESVIWLYN